MSHRSLLQVVPLIVLLLVFPLPGSAAPKPCPTNPPLPRCTPWSSQGFQHPGIYHDCASLERLQANYQSRKWAYLYSLNFSSTSIGLAALRPNATWAMQGPFPSVVWAGADGHNIPLQNDGKSAYGLTLGWFATGEPLWLSRALHIILSWAQTLVYLNEQIQGGEGLAYMTASAEILRASAGQSGWSRENTTAYLAMIERIIAPWNETTGLTSDSFFMNQGFYGNGGAMAVAVFSNNRSMYQDMLYHASVGANPDPTLDYAIPIQISGNPDYYGQVTEMGRDEYHPMGTLRGLGFLGLTSKIQHTTDLYSQNSSRLLAGWEYWAKYNGGLDVPWEPKPIRPGSGEVYATVSPSGRGRNYATYWQPLENIGVVYHEVFRRGWVDRIPYYTSYMKGMGIGWDVFEWGDDRSVANLGWNLTMVGPNDPIFVGPGWSS